MLYSNNFEKIVMTQPTAQHELNIISDVVCPWCYIAKKQFEQAIDATGFTSQFSITWRPFELNPDMPTGGVDRVSYRTQKFGSWERSLALDADVAAAGKRVGITFRHDLMQRTPNSFQAHRLILLAGHDGVQDAVVDALFKAYFIEGRDVGEASVLIEIASQAGLDSARAQKFLESNVGADEIRRQEQSAMNAEISGVPTFIIDGEVIFSGAVGAEAMAIYFRKAVAK
jgi:predicted DsbA family dithiol-disulfide isomerase